MRGQTHIHFTPGATRADMARAMKLLQNNGYQVQWCDDDNGRAGLKVFSRDGRPGTIPDALRRELEAMNTVAEVIEK